jgi:hypothetical protein
LKLDDLIARYPRVFHMTEAGSWDQIRRVGLLSTNAIARRTRRGDKEVLALVRSHRPEKTSIDVPGVGTVVLRDQRPMHPTRLQRALVDGTTPAEWYELINAKVFFWTQEKRLLGLLNSRDNRDFEHDVLTLDTAMLLEDYASKATLCRMNSGNTWPWPHARGRADFMSIGGYPAGARGVPVKEVVELTIEGHVEHISRYVVEVRRMKEAAVIRQLPL